MSEDKKPLFPRASESASGPPADLLKDVKQKLEAAERAAAFALPVVAQETVRPPMVVYGPPAFKDKPPLMSPPPAPAYGPPPFPVPRNLTFVFLLVGFLLVLFLIFTIIAVLYFT